MSAHMVVDNHTLVLAHWEGSPVHMVVGYHTQVPGRWEDSPVHMWALGKSVRYTVHLSLWFDWLWLRFVLNCLKNTIMITR